MNKVTHLLNVNRQWDKDMPDQFISTNLTAKVKLIPILQG